MNVYGVLLLGHVHVLAANVRINYILSEAEIQIYAFKWRMILLHLQHNARLNCCAQDFSQQ